MKHVHGHKQSFSDLFNDDSVIEADARKYDGEDNSRAQQPQSQSLDLVDNFEKAVSLKNSDVEFEKFGIYDGTLLPARDKDMTYPLHYEMPNVAGVWSNTPDSDFKLFDDPITRFLDVDEPYVARRTLVVDPSPYLQNYASDDSNNWSTKAVHGRSRKEISESVSCEFKCQHCGAGFRTPDDLK